MKATELRIGNLFIDEKTKTILKVIGLTNEIITFYGHFKNEWQAKPIPLTEDWLLKFGFLETEGNPFYRFFDKGDFRVFVHKSKDSIFMSWKTNTIDCTIDNLKVHQLQNLYFALTGQELTIKQ